MRKKVLKTNQCAICRIVSIPLELANKSNLYISSREDWFYLCRKCHRRHDSIGFRLINQKWYKLCKSCNNYLDTDLFYSRKTMQDKPTQGRVRPQAEFTVWCKACTKTNMDIAKLKAKAVIAKISRGPQS